MPDFFVPYAVSPEEAESVYNGFIKNSATYPLRYPTSRLFRISFKYRDKIIHAEVGRELSYWPEPEGQVLGIIETTGLVLVHAHLRGGLSATPIMVSPDDVSERVYFDNFSLPGPS